MTETISREDVAVDFFLNALDEMVGEDDPAAELGGMLGDAAEGARLWGLFDGLAPEQKIDLLRPEPGDAALREWLRWQGV